MEGDAPRLLPVCQTVVESYRATFANWRYALRISWAWFVPILALDLLIEILPENPPTRGIPIGTGFLMLYSIPLSSLPVA